jgi:hypothetical protein
MIRVKISFHSLLGLDPDPDPDPYCQFGSGSRLPYQWGLTLESFGNGEPTMNIEFFSNVTHMHLYFYIT